MFHRVSEEVRPKVAALRAAEQELRAAQKRLGTALGELDALHQSLSALQAQYDEATGRQQRLREETAQCASRMGTVCSQPRVVGRCTA